MKSLLNALSLVLLCTTGAIAEPLPEPWLSEEPFQSAPAVLLSSAYAHPFPEGADVLVLFHVSRFEMDEASRNKKLFHRIYRVLSPEGVRDWSSVSLTYSPWYQETPSVRARVITPDGVSHELDPQTLTEAPFGTTLPNVFTDTRLLSGPLPAVTVGAVIEIELGFQDKRPFFDAGMSSWVPLRYDVPLRKNRVILDAPSSLPLRYAVRGMSDMEATRTEEGGRVRIFLESGPLDPLDDPEPFAPTDTPHVPRFVWSTGESWAAVAARYLELVERQIEGSDVRKLVRKAIKGVEVPSDKIAAMVSQLHSEVRYTGVEFGQSGIIPATPAETLERKYGDCKDKSALLIAMLRSAGFTARMVLLDSGIESDPDEDMPGLGTFDHAIIHVEDPDLWIDPTDAYARPGVLAVGVAGRVALVVAPGTTSTTRTPPISSADNRMVETRVVFLAERGEARIVETTETWGLHDRIYRTGYGSPEPEKLRENLVNYVKDSLSAKELVDYEFSDPLDLSIPFKLRLEVEGARVAFSAADGAMVAIPTITIAEDLLGYLPPVADETEEETNRQRKADLVLPWPSSREWRFVVHPPPGFASAPLPADNLTRIGPTSLSEQFSLESDGTVVAVLRFDTGNRRWTPEDLRAAWEGLERLDQESPRFLNFEQLGQKQLTEGNVAGALREYRRLVELHPEEALHRREIAEALLIGGLGEAARAEAERAVKLDAEDAESHRMLGWMMLHDEIGRYLEVGCDPASAETAFRKARQLDPANVDNRQAVAYVLASDFSAVGGEPAARLDEAIEEYQSIRNELEDHSYDLELASALLRAGRFEELDRLVSEMPPSLDRGAMWVAAIAASKGVDKALGQVWSLGSTADQRSQIIGQAGILLLTIRRYPESARLLDELARKDPSATDLKLFAALVGKTRRHEELNLDEDEAPVAFLKRFLTEAFTSQGQDERVMRHLAAPQRELPDASVEEMKRLRMAASTIRAQLQNIGTFSIDTGLDMFLAGAEWIMDGDPATGYRVRLRMSVPGQEQTFDCFVVIEEGEHRLLAVAPLYWPLGVEALRRLDAGDTDGASRWLGWVGDALLPGRADDPLAVPPFHLFWDNAEPPTDRAALRHAAASLVAGSPRSNEVISILEEGRQAAGADERLKFDFALAFSYSWGERWDDLLTVARRLRVAVPDSSRAFGLETGALNELERWEEQIRIAKERWADDPNDLNALRIWSDAAGNLEQWDEAIRLLREVIDTGKAVLNDYNNIAWFFFERDNVTDEAIEFAERAVLFNESPHPASMHTLASLYAATGRTSEARELTLNQMYMRGAEKPGPLEWYVFGLIAEVYEEKQTAEMFFRRVTPPAGTDDDCGSCYRLAQKRIALLAPRPEKVVESGSTAVK